LFFTLEPFTEKYFTKKMKLGKMQSMTVAIGKLERQSIMSHVTLRDIPKEATVPTTTISRALNSKPNVSPKTKAKNQGRKGGEKIG
jgi:hypothetical protein